MTDREQRALAYRIFVQAFELHGEPRERFLERQCHASQALRREIEGLLGTAAGNGPETLALQGSPPVAEESLVGRSFGRFRLVERIGAGGMGVVYRAERTDGVQQSVAVKLVSSVVDAAARPRFEREAQLLAHLEHPAIARLIDAGIADERAWFAMEYVRGERIDAYCREHGLAPGQVVRLLIQVARAVTAAHGMLVVHSDLKPANVLINTEGSPKLVDFGIATALRDATDNSPVADAGREFSPNYAAPEQISGGSVSVATDVFGLGALAYRLLCGSPPYGEAKSTLAYLQAVSQRDVELPSRAARAAGQPPAVVRALRGDLDAILCKALERDPARRYGSAADLHEDLQRYLDHRPVRARAPSPGYRLARFMRRNVLAVGLSGLLLVSIVAGGLLAVIQGHRASVARDVAASRGEFLESMLKSADPRQGRRDITVAELLDSATRTLDQKLGSEPLVEASMLGLIADTNHGLGRYAEGLAASDRQLALLRAHGGTASELVHALGARGEMLVASGKFAESKPAFGEMLALLRTYRGNDGDYASAEYGLGQALANTGREREAEGLYRDAVERERRGNEQRRPHAGYPLMDLAVLLGHEGRYAESEAAAREALGLFRQFLPADHPDVLTAEGTYAMTLLNMRRAAEAEPLLRDLAARSARIRGPDHPDTLAAQVQLGENLMDLGRFSDAAVILRPTAESLDRVLGQGHRYSTAAWNDYATAECSGNAAADGLGAARHAAAVRARTSEPGDWRLSATQSTIGFCLVRLHRYAEAEPLLVKAAADLEQSRGAAFYQTQRAYLGLQELYQATGRTADAQRTTAKIQN